MAARLDVLSIAFSALFLAWASLDVEASVVPGGALDTRLVSEQRLQAPGQKVGQQKL